MQGGFYHAVEKRRKKSSAKIVRTLDRFASLMGGITVLVNVPQLVSVGTASNLLGVSRTSRCGFLPVSCCWLIYGILHRAKPIIAVICMLLIVQGAIVTGIFIRS